MSANLELARTHFNLGLQALGAGDWEGAEKRFRAATLLAPERTSCRVNLSSALFKQSKFTESLEQCRIALRYDPTSIQAQLTIATCLAKLDRQEDALEILDRLVLEDDLNAEVFMARGLVLGELKAFEAALQNLTRAVELAPQSADAHSNLGLLYLRLQEFELGWREYEWRWKRPHFRPGFQPTDVPKLGRKLPAYGSRVLVQCEQGLGDSIQFSRYALELVNRGQNVTLSADPRLVSLLRNSFRPSVRVLSEGELALDEFDYQISTMSLPRSLSLNDPAQCGAGSYLRPSPKKVEAWKARLGGLSNALRVGIAWSSTSNFENDRFRSLDLGNFLLGLPEGAADYVCLQKEILPKDLRDFQCRRDLFFFGAEIEDLEDTAALIFHVDMVVSTCTVIPHLAGALGKETILMLGTKSDWRWFEGRLDTPWYSSVHLERVSDAGSWRRSLEKIHAMIKKKARACKGAGFNRPRLS